MSNSYNKEEVHLGIIRGEHYWSEAKHVISEEPMIIASKQKITFDQLPYLPRINYKTEYNLKQIINNWWNQHFTEPPLVTMEVNQLEICREYGFTGSWLCNIPKSAIVENEDIYKLKLLDKNNTPHYSKNLYHLSL